MNIKLIAGATLSGLAVMFLVQNVAVVELNYLFWTLSMSRALLMILILSAGIILGWLLHGRFVRRKSNAHASQSTATDQTIHVSG